MYSGPSTWKGRGWGMGEFYETCLHPVFPPVCALACLTVQKVKTVLFSRSINPASGFTPLLPHRPLCVFYAQKMWIFRPQNCHLAPIALKKRHLSWLHPLTSLDRCRKGWHICGFSCLREAGCELLYETWPLFHHNAKYVKRNDGDWTTQPSLHHNHDNHTIIPHVLG